MRLASATGCLSVAINALLQLQLGCVDGLLVQQVRLYLLLMPFAHSPVADQNVKQHHQHLQEKHNSVRVSRAAGKTFFP